MSESVTVETVERCPHCQGAAFRRWREGFDRLHGVSEQSFVYSRCAACDLVFLSVRPVEAEIYRFYPREYGPYQKDSRLASTKPPARALRRRDRWRAAGNAALQRAKGAVERKLSFLFRDAVQSRLRGFYRVPRAGMTLLDFGCGAGKFLDKARQEGWKTIGADFSKESIERLRRDGHRAYEMSPSALEEIEDGSVDCARMNHVLEHLYHPKAVLAMIHRKLKPGGRLHVAVPNPDSMTSALFGSRWFSLDCPRHVMLYPAPVLARMLSAAGFSGVEVLHETLTKDIARSLGNVLHDNGLLRHEAIGGLMHRRLLALAMHVPARVAAFCGRADRYHALAARTP